MRDLSFILNKNICRYTSSGKCVKHNMNVTLKHAMEM